MAVTVAAPSHHPSAGDGLVPLADPARTRTARTRQYVVCPPDHFDVAYAINPWMDPTVRVDRGRAVAQWEGLVAAYRDLGHRVSVLPAVAGLPDMVFVANGALVVDGRAMVANFAHPERRPEAVHHLAWIRANVDADARVATTTNEAEGDLVVVGDIVLAGTGFHTEAASHAEVAAMFDREVVTLRLVDPRFYHLDVAVAALDDDTILWFPGALDPKSRRLLARRFPDAIEVSEADAAVLGCNVVSDGRHVLVDERARDLCVDLAIASFEPIPLAIDEFTKAGGGIKCLTMEVRPHPHDRAAREPAPGPLPAAHTSTTREDRP